MLLEAFLTCAMALPPTMHMGNHNLTEDDGMAFNALMQPARRYHGDEPPIVFAYNYFGMAKLLRRYGLRAYSMTTVLSGGHVKGLLEYFPFQPESLGGVVLNQKTTYMGLIEACEAVTLQGIIVIEEKNLPYLGDFVLFGMGFKRMNMLWHDFSIYRRRQITKVIDGSWDYRYSKPLEQKFLFHRSMLEAA